MRTLDGTFGWLRPWDLNVHDLAVRYPLWHTWPDSPCSKWRPVGREFTRWVHARHGEATIGKADAIRYLMEQMWIPLYSNRMELILSEAHRLRCSGSLDLIGDIRILSLVWITGHEGPITLHMNDVGHVRKSRWNTGNLLVWAVTRNTHMETRTNTIKLSLVYLKLRTEPISPGDRILPHETSTLSYNQEN